MILLKVKGIAFDVSGSPIILLTDEEEQRVLPVWVGPLEAHAIALSIEEIDTPRPMTHDLIKNICHQLGASISKIVICDLKENTFYAQIVLVLGERELLIDSRPSDAIALSLKAQVPVFLDEKLIDDMFLIKDIMDEDTKEEMEKLFNSEEYKFYKKSLH